MANKLMTAEFITATMDRKTLCSRERLITAFKMMDKDGSGKISAAELAVIFGVGDKVRVLLMLYCMLYYIFTGC